MRAYYVYNAVENYKNVPPMVFASNILPFYYEDMAKEHLFMHIAK